MIASQEVASTKLNDLNLTEIIMTYKVTKLGKNTQPAYEYAYRLYLICYKKLWCTKMYSAHTIQDRLLTRDSTPVMNLTNSRPCKKLQVSKKHIFTRFPNLLNL